MYKYNNGSFLQKKREKKKVGRIKTLGKRLFKLEAENVEIKEQNGKFLELLEKYVKEQEDQKIEGKKPEVQNST